MQKWQRQMTRLLLMMTMKMTTMMTFEAHSTKALSIQKSSTEHPGQTLSLEVPPKAAAHPTTKVHQTWMMTPCSGSIHNESMNMKRKQLRELHHCAKEMRKLKRLTTAGMEPRWRRQRQGMRCLKKELRFKIECKTVRKPKRK
jgi:hypothetical protein